MFKILKKYSKILFMSVLSLLCLLAGFTCISNERQYEKITASAESTFSMLDGMALNKIPGVGKIRLTVYATQEMYNNLIIPTVHDKFLWADTYEANDYYLGITRHKAGELSTADDYTVYYHLDPEHSRFSAEKFEKFSADGTFYLEFPISGDYSTEYEYTCFYYETKFDWVDKGGDSYKEWSLEPKACTNTVTRSVSYVAGKVLEYDAADYNEDELAWLKVLAGITTSSDTFTVHFIYKKLNGYANFELVGEIYQVNSLYVASPNMVYSIVSSIKGINSIADFNCVYEDEYYSKIVLQADSYTYVYDETTEIGTLVIVYRDFDYSNFAIRLQDNDLENNADLYLYLYSTDVTYEEGGQVIMTFDYATIISQCYNSLYWVFELTADNFSVGNNSKNITVNVGENAVVLSFYPQYEKELKDVSILANAEIVPDFECKVNLNYSKLTFENNTIVDEVATDTYTMMYSDYMKISQWVTFSDSDYYVPVCSALNVSELNGQEYFIPNNIECKKTAETEFDISVKYSYKTLLQINYEIPKSVRFVACTKNSLIYTYDDLYLIPPIGYRLSGLTTNGTDVIITFDETDYTNLTVKINVNTNEKKIIPLNAIYSDTWHLIVEYFDTYKETPFALKKEYKTDIKVSDYDVSDMKFSDIQEIIPDIDTKIAGMVIPDEKVTTKFSDTATYKATVTYGHASLKQIDYDGNTLEIKIPLTSYSDWCASFGKDWSILYLNTENNTYFSKSNEIAREDLYGFFSVAVFEEKVTDLNYYFRNNTGDGQMTIFDNRTAQGSNLYKFFDDQRGKGVIRSAIGHVGMALCEIFNDENKVYHSYFFFMDGSSDNGFISNGGADNAEDEDNALKNKGEDIGEDLSDIWNDLGDSPFIKILQYALLIFGLVLIGVGIYKLLEWSGIFKRK